jgi:[ribosomal protein S5]-alanine N-acetyltransferase
MKSKNFEKHDDEALPAAPRVYIRAPREDDCDEFVALMRTSARLHRGMVKPPARPAAFAEYLARCRRPNFVGHLACRSDDGRIVGVFNLSEIVRGNFQSAYLGYYVGGPFARRGYMTEALPLVLRHAFVRLKLHRVEANIQPDNAPSIALAARAGFVREGYSPRYLKVAGRWRDHERWALLAEDWKGRQRRR